MKKLKVLAFMVMATISLGCTSMATNVLATDAVPSATVDGIVNDLLGSPYNSQRGAPWGAHEGLLHGLPSNYDWYQGAKPGLWLNRTGYNAIQSWGQAYEYQGGSPEKNVRIQVRNIKTYAYQNGSWQLIENGTTNIDGVNFTEDFVSSSHQSTLRSEASNGGGVSFNMVSGYNFHWWVSNWPRAAIPSSATAIYSTAEVRLIPNTDPNVNLNNAKYLAGIGWDYYVSPSDTGDGPFPSVAIPRHRFIKPEWQTYTMYVAGNPPTSEVAYKNLITSIPLPPGVTNGSTTDPDPNPDPEQQESIFEAENGTLAGNARIQNASNASNGKVIGNLNTNGDFVQINNVSSQNGGEASITIRYANGYSDNRTLSLYVNNTKIQQLTFAPTGGWNTFQNLSPITINLNASTNNTIKIQKDSTDIAAADIDKFVVTTSTTQTPDPDPEGNVYSEDFSDNSAQNWNLSSNVVVSNNKLSISGWQENASAIFNGQNFVGPFNYNIDVYGYGGGLNYTRIVFNYADNNNYYYVETSGGASATVTLKKKVNGTISTIATYGVYQTNGQWVKFNISYANNQITVKTTKSNIETTLFNNIVDTSLQSGKIGVMTNWNNVDIDNVVVNY